MRVGVGINVPGGGSWSTPRRSKPKSGADDQLHCVGESRITSHNIAAFRHPTDSMKDSKQGGELIEEESVGRIPDSTAMLLAVDSKERAVAIWTGLPQEKTPQCPLKGSVARNDLC